MPGEAGVPGDWGHSGEEEGGGGGGGAKLVPTSPPLGSGVLVVHRVQDCCSSVDQGGENQSKRSSYGCGDVGVQAEGAMVHGFHGQRVEVGSGARGRVGVPVGGGGSISALSDVRKGAGWIHSPAVGRQVVTDHPVSIPMGRGGAHEVLPICLDADNKVALMCNGACVFCICCTCGYQQCLCTTNMHGQ